MITCRVDPRGILGSLTEAQERQVPFAVSRALNRTGTIAQKAEQDRLAQVFKIRREWVTRGIYIAKEDRSSKSTWRVVIKIQDDRSFLDKFERGDPKDPFKGRYLWVPNAEIFQNRIITRANPLHPSALKFDAHGEGPRGTFMVHTPKGPLVLQHISATGRATKVAKRRVNARVIYTLVSRVKVGATLEFSRTIGTQAQAAFPAELRKSLDEAMRTAK